jgi:hypothetical protein
MRNAENIAPVKQLAQEWHHSSPAAVTKFMKRGALVTAIAKQVPVRTLLHWATTSCGFTQ